MDTAIKEELRRIQSIDNTLGFDRTLHSLQAIAAAVGIGPGISISMFGRCAVGMAASQTVITTDNLGVSLPDDVFNGNFYMTILRNTNAVGTAPEGEWRRIADFVGATQTFTTDAFSANVEEGDLLIVAHESILFGQPLARGTLDTSSATVPADSTRGEGNDYFNGALLMTTEGAQRFQPRRVVDYTGAGGIFTLDPGNPLTGVPGLVDYVVLPFQGDFVPGVDAVINRTPPDVLGNKADTPQYADIATASVLRYLKGLAHQKGLSFFGDVTDLTDLNNFASTDLAGRENAYFVGWYVFCLRDDGGAGAAPQGEYRLVTDYVSATGAFVHNAFSVIMVAGDQVLLVHPMLYEILTIRGGAETLESLSDELDAVLDLGEGDPQTLLMTGAEQTLYETTGSAFIYEIYSLKIDWTGLNFGAGEDTTIRVYEKIDGANYREIYSETFLAAALPSPIVTPHPRNINTDVVLPTMVTKQDYKVTAEQDAIGAGWNTLAWTVIDAKRGA